MAARSAVGVPEIVQKFVSKMRPVGSVPVSAQLTAAPPVFAGSRLAIWVPLESV